MHRNASAIDGDMRHGHFPLPLTRLASGAIWSAMAYAPSVARHTPSVAAQRPCPRLCKRPHERPQPFALLDRAVQSPFLKFPFLAPRGAPGLNPPCKRHRLRPRIARRWHGVPARVLAPHFGARLSLVSSSFMGLITFLKFPFWRQWRTGAQPAMQAAPPTPATDIAAIPGSLLYETEACSLSARWRPTSSGRPISPIHRSRTISLGGVKLLSERRRPMPLTGEITPRSSFVCPHCGACCGDVFATS